MNIGKEDEAFTAEPLDNPFEEEKRPGREDEEVYAPTIDDPSPVTVSE